MKRIFYIVLFFISAENCFGQQVTFQKTYGGIDEEQELSVQQTTDDGYIIAGATSSFGAGLDDLYLIKTDFAGNILWTKTIGGMDYDQGFSVRQTSDGGYIIAGIMESAGGRSYLIKTDSLGNSAWIKSYYTLDVTGVKSVLQTADGGYIMAGVIMDFLGSGALWAFLIKTDANGILLWTKIFTEAYFDGGWSVQQTTDGGYIIGGASEDSLYNKDVYLIKTDTIGNLVWAKTFGGTNYDIGYSALQTSDGGYIVVGSTSSFGSGLSDVYLVKTDANGDTLWTKTYGGLSDDAGHSIQQTTDGGFIIAGRTFASTTNHDLYLIKIDFNGNLLWAKHFGGTGDDRGNSVQQTTDGGYIIAGYGASFGAGSYDIYLVKTDSLGNSGCNEGSTATIVTTPATQVTIPATIVASPPTIVTTPATIVGSGGTVTTLCTTVGIKPIFNLQSSIFNISPNPTTNNFTITFPNTINKGVIEIYNVLGVPINIGISEDIINVSQKEIRLDNINAGIYFVKVKDREKEYCKKLVIE